jgi:hypothetical protein
VVWDASHGGSLSIEAAGLALPVGRRELRLVIGLVVLLAAVLGVIRWRKKNRSTACGGCGRPVSAAAKFCRACGQERLA